MVAPPGKLIGLASDHATSSLEGGGKSREEPHRIKLFNEQPRLSHELNHYSQIELQLPY